MFANRNMRDFYAPASFPFKPQRSHCRAFFCFYPFPLPPIAWVDRSLFSAQNNVLGRQRFWEIVKNLFSKRFLTGVRGSAPPKS